MWMGGVPPLGYDVRNRRLVINECEAKTVRHIFQRFVELGSSTLVVKELRLDGVTSKAWTTQEGRIRQGKPVDKSLIYKLINNLNATRGRALFLLIYRYYLPNRENQEHAGGSGLPRLPAAEFEAAVLEQLRGRWWPTWWPGRSNSTRPSTKRRSWWP